MDTALFDGLFRGLELDAGGCRTGPSRTDSELHSDSKVCGHDDGVCIFHRTNMALKIFALYDLTGQDSLLGVGVYLLVKRVISLRRWSIHPTTGM